MYLLSSHVMNYKCPCYPADRGSSAFKSNQIRKSTPENSSLQFCSSISTSATKIELNRGSKQWQIYITRYTTRNHLRFVGAGQASLKPTGQDVRKGRLHISGRRSCCPQMELLQKSLSSVFKAFELIRLGTPKLSRISSLT